MRFPSLALSTLYLTTACHAFTAPHRPPSAPIPSGLFSTAEAESTAATTVVRTPIFADRADRGLGSWFFKRPTTHVVNFGSKIPFQKQMLDKIRKSSNTHGHFPRLAVF